MRRSIVHLRNVSLAIALLAAGPALAQKTPLTQRVTATLKEQGPGARFGLLVQTLDGKEIVAINPDDRFVPASNTKLFTTASAFANMPDLTQPDTRGGAAVRIEGRDVILEGRGDARLSSAKDCAVNCLSELAAAIARKTKSVRDVIGDDTFFPDERWSPGMSWNNIQTRYGTGISALTIDDNEYVITVTPGAREGDPVKLAGLGYYKVDNRLRTVAAGESDIDSFRAPNTRDMRMTGTVAAGGEPITLRFGIDDPADYAAFRLRALLIERGVRVRGQVRTHHRPLTPLDSVTGRKGAPVSLPPLAKPLAQLTPSPLLEDLKVVNKVSQNLHSELFLRRVSRIAGSGSIADGQSAVQAMLTRAAVPRWAYDFADGSGMSNYNRVSPRATVQMLRWSVAQPWGVAFRDTLPVGGVDGTLARRFKGTPLEGKVFAKTGTLNQSNALGGFMTTASGKTLVFAAYANDMPEDASATKTLDAALNLIAAEN